MPFAVFPDGSLEVEFVNAAGHTLGIITLGPEDVRSLEGSEILHVRPLSTAFLVRQTKALA
jgi:hypothetical protein